jgi:hypothetical protein
LPPESGLVISAHEGTPLSAKYEIDDGIFQLSVYVMKPGAFAEVIVDHDAGTVAKVVEITDGGDLVAAQTQRIVMAGAQYSLATATSHAVDANRGYRAVNVTPVLLGHSSLAMTMRYAHLAPERLRSAVTRLEGLTSGKPSASPSTQASTRESVKTKSGTPGVPGSA